MKTQTLKAVKWLNSLQQELQLSNSDFVKFFYKRYNVALVGDPSLYEETSERVISSMWCRRKHSLPSNLIKIISNIKSDYQIIQANYFLSDSENQKNLLKQLSLVNAKKPIKIVGHTILEQIKHDSPIVLECCNLATNILSNESINLFGCNIGESDITGSSIVINNCISNFYEVKINTDVLFVSDSENIIINSSMTDVVESNNINVTVK